MNVKHAVGCLALALVLGCGSTSSSEAPPAGDAGPSTDGGRDAAVDHEADALPTADGGDAGDAAPMTSRTCPSSGDPVACDDGTGSLGTKAACPTSTVPGSAVSYHLQVSGSMFTTIGACLYVTPTSCSSAKADVMEFSGSDGTSPGAAFNGLGESSPYCFRLLSVAWDSNWADDGMTTGGPAGMGGNVLAASLRPKAVMTWVHTYLRTSDTTPLCGSGGSAGSSELLFQLMHNGGEALLDHVQLNAATPYARFDLGCNNATPAEGSNVVCSALPPGTAPQYSYLEGSSNPGAVRLVAGGTHDPNCDADGGVQSASEAAALQAMSLVTNGFVPVTLHHTSLSVYMCATVPNATQGEAVYVFGKDADLASADAGPYTGLLSLQLATPFYGCTAGSTCVPHIVCDPSCATETFGSTSQDKLELAADMQNNCVLRH